MSIANAVDGNKRGGAIRVQAANLNAFDFRPYCCGVVGLEKVGEGYTAELYVWPGGLVKLFRRADALPAAMAEAEAMLALQDIGFPMPRTLGTAMIEGRPGIVIERLNEPDQLSILGSKPWMVQHVGLTLARLHAQIHAAAAPEQLIALKPTLQLEIESAANIPPDVSRIALDLLARSPDFDAVCHWDFHPGNLIKTPGGAKAIDWAVVRRGDPLADVARTSILIRRGMMPPGTPLLVQKLKVLGRACLSRSYLREYRRLRPYHDLAFRRWQYIVATSRLSCGLAEEREGLLAELQRVHRGLTDER